MRAILSTSVLLLCTSAWSAAPTPQNSDPVGGWYKPLWDYSFSNPSNEVEEIMDCTGDGKPDFLFMGAVSGFPHIILDGQTGGVWFQSPSSQWDEVFVNVGDFDGDGIGDVLLREPNHDSNGLQDNGRLTLIQGGSGVMLWQRDGLHNSDNLGLRCRAMELNGDGILDFVTFVPEKFLLAFAGVSGKRLWSKRDPYANRVTKIPDINGDGIGEISLTGGFRFVLLDGETGQVMWSTLTDLGKNSSRINVLLADLNLDGIQDLILTNASLEVGVTLPGAGQIQAFDGKTGASLWIAQGTKALGGLGSSPMLADWNGDGIMDILSVSANYQAMVDGYDGTLLWHWGIQLQAGSEPPFFRKDMNIDGLPDLVLRVSDANHSLRVINCVTGLIQWEVPSLDPSYPWGPIQVVDLNGNGSPEIVATVPEGSGAFARSGILVALDGMTGLELWRREGEQIDARLGSHIFVEQADQISGPDVLARVNAHGPDSGILACSGLNGADIWRLPLGKYPGRYLQWNTVDLDDDGIQELLEFSEIEGGNVRISKIDPLLGEVSVFHEVKTLTGLLTFIGGIEDVDGDGIQEILVIARDGAPNWKLQPFSGGQKSYTTGLTLSDDQISIAAGAKIEIAMDFHAMQGNQGYQLLISSSGTGPIMIEGTDVPLSRNYWLAMTYFDAYPPGYFMAPTGQLNEAGDGRITFEALPGRINSSMAGTTLHLAVVTRARPGQIRFSSGAESILLLP